FQLEWTQVAANGVILGTNVAAGSINLGQVVTYTFNAVPTGPPSLHFSDAVGSLTLSWTTNYVGYSLQTTTNLSSPSSWVLATNAVGQINGLNLVRVGVSDAKRFFRLAR